MAGHIERLSDQVAALIVRNGLDHLQTKAVFKAARQKAGLAAPQPRRGAPNRLTLEHRRCASSPAPMQGAARSG